MSWYQFGKAVAIVIDNLLKSMVFWLRLSGVLILAIVSLLGAALPWPLQIIWAISIIFVALLFRHATRELEPFGIEIIHSEKRRLE